MPRLNQPVPLQKLAFDSLVGHTVRYCDGLTCANSPLNELRESVFVIRQYLSDRMPGTMFAEFCAGFLKKRDEIGPHRPILNSPSHQRAALEMTMDVDIAGLRLEGPIVRHLDLSDGHRLHGLTELNLNYFPTDVPMHLDVFDLQNLVVFHFERSCTDAHLRFLGRNCSKLEILKVPNSRCVTFEGLRALSPCSELRVVDVVGCLIPPCTISSLLSEYKKIEDFSHGQSHDIFFHLDSAVCPFMKRFVINSCMPLTTDQLQTVIVKFPNLTHLRIRAVLTGGLAILRTLDKLTGLDLESCVFYDYAGVIATWESLRELLRFNGTNITRLQLKMKGTDFVCVQNDVDFIFHTCPNIEYLSFECTREKLVVPSFRKLKELVISDAPAGGWLVTTPVAVLELGKMLELETLQIGRFFVIYRDFSFDNDKFPNLTRVFLNAATRTPQVCRIGRLAKDHNLDFTFGFV